MSLYCKKTDVVDAIQLKHPVRMTTPEGILYGNPGDWLVTTQDGKQFFCNSNEFYYTYWPVDENPTDELTPREWKVAYLVAQGLGNKEIAQRLNIATSTVANHVANIMRKLGTSSRVGIVYYVLNRGEVRVRHENVSK